MQLGCLFSSLLLLLFLTIPAKPPDTPRLVMRLCRKYSLEPKPLGGLEGQTCPLPPLADVLLAAVSDVVQRYRAFGGGST